MPPKTYDLTGLSAAELQAIQDGLGQLPFLRVVVLWNKVQEQINRQNTTQLNVIENQG